MSSAENNTVEKIYIDLIENEKCVLNDRNEIIEMQVDGTLKVVNPSRECRIWNANLQVAGIQGTNLPEGAIAVGEVQAKAEWSQPYSVATDQPLLRLVEVIDTCSALK